MPFAHDDLYDRPQSVVDFRFDERTAAVFPDMIHRSIPGYASLLQQLGVIAGALVGENARVYDLGCSLGGATLAMQRFLPASAEIIALDVSPAMVHRFQEYVSGAGLGNVAVIEGDILDYPLQPAKLVVMNFVLQFLPAEKRQAMVDRVYQSLLPGGALILAAKTRPENPVMRDWHEAFKAAQGYSTMAIAQKRESLEQVMQTDSVEVEIERMQRAGFSRITPFFQGMMFQAWVAEK